MANQSTIFQPAIDELEKDLNEAERHANALRTSINVLRAKAGLAPRPDGGGGGGSPTKEALNTPSNVKSDQFFGKKKQSAIRELLEIRKAQGLDPPTTREIYDGLLAGGFTFEAKDDETAMIGLRATLRKRSETFVKMQNGRYGLLAWYPNAKKPKVTSAKDGSPESATAPVATQKETASPEDEAAA